MKTIEEIVHDYIQSGIAPGTLDVHGLIEELEDRDSKLAVEVTRIVLNEMKRADV